MRSTLVVEAIGYGVLFGAIAGVVGALVVKARAAARLDGLCVGADPAGCDRRRSPTGSRRRSVGAGSSPRSSRASPSAPSSGDTGGETTYLVDELGELTNGVTFIVFGAAIVGPVLAGLTWRAALYGVLSLTVVRMVPVAVALLGTHARRRRSAFVGWFGPRGLASIVFTIIVLEDGGLPHSSTITVAVVFTIVLSVYAHGFPPGR